MKKKIIGIISTMLVISSSLINYSFASSYDYNYFTDYAKRNNMSLSVAIKKIDSNCAKTIFNTYIYYIIKYWMWEWNYNYAPNSYDDSSIEDKINWFRSIIWIKIANRIDSIATNLVENKFWLKNWKLENLTKVCKIHNAILYYENTKFKNNDRIKKILDYLDFALVSEAFKYVKSSIDLELKWLTF